MSKDPAERVGLWSKFFMAFVVVVWFAIAIGNFTGRYIIDQKILEEGGEGVEFRDLKQTYPRPWSHVSPRHQAIAEGKDPTGLGDTPVAEGSKEAIAKEQKAKAPDQEVEVLEAQPEPSFEGEGYFLHFGAFQDRANAEDLRKNLAETHKLTLKIEEHPTESGSYYHLIGAPMADYTKAKEKASQLSVHGVDVFVESTEKEVEN